MERAAEEKQRYEATEQELKQNYEMFAESWRFYRKWAVVPKPMTEQRWEQVVKEAHEFREKYGGTRTAEYLMLAVTNELDQQERKIKHNENSFTKKNRSSRV